MSRISIAPIVEGHGEQQSAIGTLLRRVWSEVVGGEYAQILPAIRVPRSKLVQRAEMRRAIGLAALKLKSSSEPRQLVLVVFDADEDLPCVLAPRISGEVAEDRPDIDVSVVIANVEYETWFVAAAESLRSYFNSRVSVTLDPEMARLGKGTILKWMNNRYAETIDQPRMTGAMDLRLVRERSKSFDKLCRELEKRC